MPRKASKQRSRHNPIRLPCQFPHCQRSFKNRGGLTKHIRSQHSGQTAPRSPQHSPQRSPLPDRSSLPPAFSSPQGSLRNSPIGEVPFGSPGGQADDAADLANLESSHPLINGLHPIDF